MASEHAATIAQKTNPTECGTDRANCGTMQLPKASPCDRFIILDDLHLDRVVFETLARWSSKNDLRLQDAIQLAICVFNESSRTMCYRAVSDYGDRHDRPALATSAGD